MRHSPASTVGEATKPPSPGQDAPAETHNDVSSLCHSPGAHVFNQQGRLVALSKPVKIMLTCRLYLYILGFSHLLPAHALNTQTTTCEKLETCLATMATVYRGRIRGRHCAGLFRCILSSNSRRTESPYEMGTTIVFSFYRRRNQGLRHSGKLTKFTEFVKNAAGHSHPGGMACV